MANQWESIGVCVQSGVLVPWRLPGPTPRERTAGRGTLIWGTAALEDPLRIHRILATRSVELHSRAGIHLAFCRVALQFVRQTWCTCSDLTAGRTAVLPACQPVRLPIANCLNSAARVAVVRSLLVH